MKILITGLLTALAAVVVSFFQANGFPATTVAWEVLGIIVGLNIVQYLIKNWLMPSTSIIGNTNLRDVLSGCILAVCNGLSFWAASALTSTTLDWHSLLVTSGTLALTYLGTKYGFGKPVTPTPTTAS